MCKHTNCRRPQPNETKSKTQHVQTGSGVLSGERAEAPPPLKQPAAGPPPPGRDLTVNLRLLRVVTLSDYDIIKQSSKLLVSSSTYARDCAGLDAGPG